uniref:Uncharacterized protein n=1 Tax=viral metagenome TaxID=1070528 RepID=A0A6C0LZP0_9ZZZZ
MNVLTFDDRNYQNELSETSITVPDWYVVFDHFMYFTCSSILSMTHSTQPNVITTVNVVCQLSRNFCSIVPFR